MRVGKGGEDLETLLQTVGEPPAQGEPVGCLPGAYPRREGSHPGETGALRSRPLPRT